MEKKEMLYEGKAKKVYTTEDPDVLIVSYKDDGGEGCTYPPGSRIK